MPPLRLSYTSIERPRASVVPSSVRASTNDTSPSPFVMNRLTPLSNHVCFSSDHVALSITAPKSEPASGSVRSIAHVAPSHTHLRYFAFCSSVANSLNVSAQSCKPQIFSKLASARATISFAITKHVSGKFKPPKRRGRVNPFKPASFTAFIFSTVPDAYITRSFSTRGPS